MREGRPGANLILFGTLRRGPCERTRVQPESDRRGGSEAFAQALRSIDGASRGLGQGAILTRVRGWGLAHAWYQGKDKPGSRRPSPEQAQALLASLGLVGESWNLRDR